MLKAWQVVAVCVVALLSLGVVMVNSASMELPSAKEQAKADAAAAEAAASEAKPATPAPRNLSVVQLVTSPNAIFMGIAILAMTCAAFFPVRRFAERISPGDFWGIQPSEPADPKAGYRVLFFGVVILMGILLLVYLPGVGRQIKGAERWLRLSVPGLGQVSIQPSEIAKWSMLGLLAWYSTRRAAFMPRFWKGLVPALIALCVIVAIVVKEDLGTGVLIMMASTVLLLAAGARFWHFAALTPIAAAGLAAAVLTSEYRMQRLRTFFDSKGAYADAQGSGYHIVQSLAAVSGGGVTGRGLGYGVQKFGYLPEDTNDFIFAVICEELGAAGAAVVITLYGVLLWGAMTIVIREHSRVLKLFGLGVIATVTLQAVINMAVVTALGPTKGIALPLVSAGGTGWTLTAFSLGLLIAIGRTQGRESLATGGSRLEMLSPTSSSAVAAT